MVPEPCQPVKIIPLPSFRNSEETVALQASASQFANSDPALDGVPPKVAVFFPAEYRGHRT